MNDLPITFPTKPYERKVVKVLKYSSIDNSLRKNLQKPFKILHRVPVERIKGKRLIDEYA